MTSSVAEIQQKIDALQEQRNQVFLAKAANPNNETLAKLILDLDEAIKLQYELLALRRAQEKQNRIAEAQQIESFKKGDYVYGFYQGAWYVATVEEVVSHEDAEEDQTPDYIVKYIGYGNTAVLNASKRNIKAYYDPPVEYFAPGSKVYAVFAEDGLFYEGTIDSLTEDKTAFITFNSYGNIQETPFRNIRLLNYPAFYAPKPQQQQQPAQQQQQQAQAGAPSTSVQQQQQQQAAAKSEIDAKKEQKEKKKKKKKEKMKQMDAERAEKQSSWKNFLKSDKMSKLRKKDSMFKSDAAGKVGVIHGKEDGEAAKNNFTPLTKKIVKTSIESIKQSVRN